MNNLTSLPTVAIEINGVAIPDIGSLTNVRVQQRLSLPTLCEFTIAQNYGAPLRSSEMKPGASIRIALFEHREPLFSGEITAVEFCYGPTREPEIRVRAYDLMHRMRKQQALRAHVQVTFSDVVELMADEAGLPVADESNAGNELMWTYIIQHQQTNLDILLEMAARLGLYLTVRDGELYVINLEGLGDPVLLTIGDNIIEAQVEINADQACTSVTALAWDAQHIKVYDEKVDWGINNPSNLVNGSMGGSAVDRKLVDQTALTSAHATSLAAAEYARRTIQTVTLRGATYGDPRLCPGARVELGGGDREINGRYILSNVTHTIDPESGFVSEFSTVLPQPPERNQSTVATPGYVTQLVDPDRLGRVRVVLPTYGGVETDWMPVLTLGAGSGKGLLVQPQPGDSVLVLLTHGDPGQGVVLGGLYGTQGLPVKDLDTGSNTQFKFITGAGQRIDVDDKNRTIKLETGNGQHIEVDDKNHTIMLRTHDGSSIELTPHKLLIHANSDLILEAPDKSIVLRGKNIDFQRG